MRPEISNILQHIYPGLKDDQSVMHYDDVKGVSKNMFFISHSEPEKTDDEMNFWKFIFRECITII